LHLANPEIRDTWMPQELHEMEFRVLRPFGSLLAFVYHCFDCIVIRCCLPLLTAAADGRS